MTGKSILKKYFEWSIFKILSTAQKVFKIRISNTSISNTAYLCTSLAILRLTVATLKLLLWFTTLFRQFTNGKSGG